MAAKPLPRHDFATITQKPVRVIRKSSYWTESGLTSFRHGQMNAKICLSFRFQRSIDRFEEVCRATGVNRDQRGEKKKWRVFLSAESDTFGARDFDCLVVWERKLISKNIHHSESSRFGPFGHACPRPTSSSQNFLSDDEGFVKLSLLPAPIHPSHPRSTKISLSSSGYKKCNQGRPLPHSWCRPKNICWSSGMPTVSALN